MDFSLESLGNAISGLGNTATTYYNARAAVNAARGSGGSSAPAPTSAATVGNPSSGMSGMTMALAAGGLLLLVGVVMLRRKG